MLTSLHQSAEERAFRQLLRRRGVTITVRRPVRLRVAGQPVTSMVVAEAAAAGAETVVLGPASPGGLVGSVPAGLVLDLDGIAHTTTTEATATDGTVEVSIAPALTAPIAVGDAVALPTHADVELPALVGSASTSARKDWEGTRRVVELLAEDLGGTLTEGDEILRGGRSLGRVVGWRRSEDWVLAPVVGSTAP